MVILIACGNFKNLDVKIYYIDGATEIVSINQRVYSDNSRSPLHLEGGCLFYPNSNIAIACGVKKYQYLN